MTDSTSQIERRLAEIEARAAKATEGPWAWEQYGEKENCYHIGIAFDKDDKPVSGRAQTERYDEEKDIFIEDLLWKNDFGDMEGATVNYGDADFIAASRTDIPWLVARLRAAMAVVEILQEPTRGPYAGRAYLASKEPELSKALAAFDALAGEETQ